MLYFHFFVSCYVTNFKNWKYIPLWRESQKTIPVTPCITQYWCMFRGQDKTKLCRKFAQFEKWKNDFLTPTVSFVYTFAIDLCTSYTYWCWLHRFNDTLVFPRLNARTILGEIGKLGVRVSRQAIVSHFHHRQKRWDLVRS